MNQNVDKKSIFVHKSPQFIELLRTLVLHDWSQPIRFLKLLRRLRENVTSRKRKRRKILRLLISSLNRVTKKEKRAMSVGKLKSGGWK